MSAKTAIEWTDYSWNPVSGCDKVSPGCDHCYAETIATRFAGTKAYPDGFKVTLRPDRLTDPLRKRSWRGKRVFVNSMSDLFHKDVPDAYIAQVFAVMALAPEVTFQVLTKRHGRMQSLLSSDEFVQRVWFEAGRLHLAPNRSGRLAPRSNSDAGNVGSWPLPNVWLGVSVEDQQRADLRIPALLGTPAAVRFLSCEPLLGPVDLTHMDVEGRLDDAYWINALTGENRDMGRPCRDVPHVDWVIVGGESGPGARPMHPGRVRSLRDQCEAAGTPFLFKQWGDWTPFAPDGLPAPGGYVSHADGALVDEATALADGGDFTAVWRVGKTVAGRTLDGQTWDQYPEVTSWTA